MKLSKLSAVAVAVAFVGSSVFGATAAHAADIADPQGTLLDTKTATITATPGVLDLNNSADWLVDGNLGGDSICNLDVTGGDRVYQALNLKILLAGHYTFRIVQTNPEFGGDYTASPIQDPFLALYSGFTTANLDSGLIGCNDDEYNSALNPSWSNGDTFPTNGVSNTNDRWSHFEADLQPGDYTVVLTTWAPVTLANWAANAPQSADFEYWGPNCGIEGGTCNSAASLANTGVDVSGIALLASALLAVGIVVVVRRRAIKA